MKKSNKSIILITSIILIFCVVLVYFNNAENNKNLSEELIEKINLLNEKVDEYYVNEWINEKFLSVASYFSKGDNSLVTIEDIEEFGNIEIDEELNDVSFHFVKPSSLLKFLPEGILEEDLDLMTVYTALPVEGGVYISSYYDEGGVISNEEYKEFLLNNYFEHGEIVNPNKDEKEYENILEVVSNSNEEVKDGNVKYIAYDDKYAVLVISTNSNPSYTKQFVLIKGDNNWEVSLSGLESKKNTKLVINYEYNDLNLNLLPIYEVSSYSIIENLEDYLNLVIEQGFFENEEIVYSSGAGNFVYFESKEGTKLIVYIEDNSNVVLYEIGNYKEGISLMTSLEEIPPVFILNFEN